MGKIGVRWMLFVMGCVVCDGISDLLLCVVFVTDYPSFHSNHTTISRFAGDRAKGLANQVKDKLKGMGDRMKDKVKGGLKNLGGNLRERLNSLGMIPFFLKVVAVEETNYFFPIWSR